MSGDGTMTTDPIELHKRVVRLIDLAAAHGAPDDAIRAALAGPLHPDYVNVPAAGRFPPIDPAPYLAAMTADERFRHDMPSPGEPLCGALVTEEDSDRILKGPTGWTGITTCVLPRGHTRGWGEGSRPPHRGILLPVPDEPSMFGPTLWQWLGPVRELGQVARR